MKNIIITLLLIEFCFSKTVSISGSIINDEGKPSRKAEVTLFGIDDSPIGLVKTNRKGRFEFSDINPDYYYLVANHQDEGMIRIKINPRKARNRDLLLRLNLKKETEIPLIYTYSNVKPIQKDPALRIKKINTSVDDKSIQLSWKTIPQAIKYEIFRDDKLLFKTESDTYLDTTTNPGVKYCYQIMAIGKYGVTGVLSESYCNSSLTGSPESIGGTVNKNNITIKWGPVKGAAKYNIKQNNKTIGYSSEPIYDDDSLDFSTNYYYTISSISPNGVEGLSSEVYEIRTRDYVEPPTLSSFNNDNSINLIWNEVGLAISYNLYRDGALIKKLNINSYKDECLPGETHCYQITSIDKYNVESELSEKHCSKLFLKSPGGLKAVGGIRSNQLSWNNVSGIFEYKIYKQLENDSTTFIDKVKSSAYLDRDLGYDEEHCYTISAIDAEGDASGFSQIICGKTNTPPDLQIKNYKLIENSSNNSLDARESGKLRFALLNNGNSPSKNIRLSIRPSIDNDVNDELMMDTIKIIDNLNIDEAKYLEFDVSAGLKVNSGDWKYNIMAVDENGFKIKMPYEFSVNTKAVDSPNIILADYSIENNFGTNYIPKSEPVELTVRVQNVGQGLTEKIEFNLLENHTYSAIDFTGYLELNEMTPGEFTDINFKIKSEREQFSIKFKTTDYLDNTVSHQIDLELMKHYRGKNDLVIQEIGAKNIVPYPTKLGELEIEKNIPIGKRNPNGMAVILAVDKYEDISLTEPKYTRRDGEIFRLYMQNAFGLDDYQILPSKPWQMESGPDKRDFNKIFDPHQGIIRNRVISSSKYSNIEYVDINIYYSGLGMWYDGNPYLIPKDGNSNQIASLCSLEKILTDLSLLSVLQNINSITVILDIKYINHSEMSDGYRYPNLSEKICILAASSTGESSLENDEMKHSVFSYFLFKGLKGDAMGSDNKIELGELAEYLYRKVPEASKKEDNSKLQNPEFIGSDLKRILLDLR